MVDDFIVKNEMSNRIEIKLSKRKIIFLLIAAVAFMILGYLGAVKPEGFVSPIFRNPEAIRISGIAAVCFFGVCIVFVARKLFDNKPGLIIDQKGITDNSNATSVGLIEWDDITGLEKIQILSSRILIIHTDKPDKYINRSKDKISKRAMKANHELYRSPLSIISNSLQIGFNDLEKLIRDEFEKNKKEIM